jgi:hypothetical protein
VVLLVSGDTPFRPLEDKATDSEQGTSDKERNRRVFDGLTSLPSRVLSLIKEENKLRSLVCGGDELFAVS